MIPREHGAWAMLLAPFAAAVILARQWGWELIPALVAVVGVFVLREPLVVWLRGRPSEAARGRRFLLGYALPTAAAGLVLLWRLPPAPLVTIGAAAAGLMALSTWLILHNRQRSLLLQLASAAGLNGAGVVAWLAAGHDLDPRVFWLWALLFAHSAAAVLVVHARLEARKAQPPEMWRQAALAQAALAAGAAALLAAGRWPLAVPLAVSASVHAWDLRALRRGQSVRMPLRRVGFRALALSLVVSALTLAALWR